MMKRIVDEGNSSLIVGLLSFPILIQVLANFSFLVGGSIGRWHAPIALLAALIVAYVLSASELRIRNLLVMLCVAIVSVLVAALPVMFSISDAAAYHRAGVSMLSNGWNPLRLTEVVQMGMVEAGYRPWHLMFLPRGVWIIGAALYRVFGFVEAADAFCVYSVLVSLICLRRFVRPFVACLICFSPAAMGGLIGGGNDPVMYACVIMALFSMGHYVARGEKFSLVVCSLSVVLMSGVKYTGVVFGALIFMVAIAHIVISSRSFRSATCLISLGVVTVLMIVVTNVSPYVTSTINHGGPFYPSHTFVDSERIEDKLTFDFDVKNADSREMGYAGRFCYAYVSKELTKLYYKIKLHKEEFSPKIQLFADVDGYGSLHRLAFLLALIGLFYVKDRMLRFVAITILISVLAQPTKFMGYARYVPQVYVFPMVVAIGVFNRISCHRKLLICASIVAGGVYWCVLVLPGVVKLYPYAYLASVQNLQIIEHARTDSSSCVVSPICYGRTMWSYDVGYNGPVYDNEARSPKSGVYVYEPCSRRYKFFTKAPISGYYDFSFGASMVGETMSVDRRGAPDYFVKTFLPSEVSLMGKRMVQWMKLRQRQLRTGHRVDASLKARLDSAAKVTE